MEAGGAGHIIAKLNALVEPEVIQALYRASSAGVMIDLIVRGICCLRPGIPGISDNIRVRSIVGRFLEHSRVYYFHANGDENLFCASADWMDRNFFRRIEVCFPISDATLKARILADLDANLLDNCQAWELRSDGSYQRAQGFAGRGIAVGPGAIADTTCRKSLRPQLRRRIVSLQSAPARNSCSRSRSASVSGLLASHPDGNCSSSERPCARNPRSGSAVSVRLR